MSIIREQMIAAFRKKWSIIPLRKDSKLPNLPTGHKFLTTPPTEDDYKGFDFGNYGVVCGNMSGITVLDVDYPKGNDIIFGLGIEPEGIETPQVFTPNGGRHMFFKYNKDVRTGVGVLGRGIDIRNDGSYVVGAGSVVEGASYVWHEIYGPDTPLSPVPDWLVNGRKERDVERTMLTKLGEGERNSKLFSLARSLVNRELPSQLVFECIMLVNNKWSKVPLSREEVDKIAKSAESYGVEKR